MATSVKFPQSYVLGNNDVDVTFNNPTNAYADDTNYLTIDTTKRSDYDWIDYYNFDFGIPAGSTINSITVEIEWRVSTTASDATMHLQTYKNTTAQGSALTNSSEPTTFATQTNTNNGTWTVTELNSNASTGMRQRVTLDRGGSNTDFTMTVNYVKVTIDYAAGPQTVYPDALDNVNSFGTATVDHRIYPTAHSNSTSFGTVSAKHIIYITLLANNNLMGAPQVDQVIYASLYDNTNSFGDPEVVNQLQIVEPNALDNSQSFGTPTLAIDVSPTAHDNSIAFGTPQVDQVIYPGGFDNSNTFGTASVVADQIVHPDAIVSTVSFGTHVITNHTSTKYPKFREHLLQGDLDFDLDTIKMILIDTGTYTYSPTDEYFSHLTGTIGSGVELTSKSYTNGVFDAADIVFEGVTSATIGAVILYQDTGTPNTSILIAYIDNATEFPITTNYDDVTIHMDSGVNKIFAL